MKEYLRELEISRVTDKNIWFNWIYHSSLDSFFHYFYALTLSISKTIAKLTELIVSSNSKESNTGIQLEYKSLLELCMKEKWVSSDNIFISIGEKVFNVVIEAKKEKVAKKKKEEDSIVDFDYIKVFIKDIFIL